MLTWHYESSVLGWSYLKQTPGPKHPHRDLLATQQICSLSLCALILSLNTIGSWRVTFNLVTVHCTCMHLHWALECAYLALGKLCLRLVIPETDPRAQPSSSRLASYTANLLFVALCSESETQSTALTMSLNIIESWRMYAFSERATYLQSMPEITYCAHICAHIPPLCLHGHSRGLWLDQGPIDFLPSSDLLVRNMERQWGDLDRYLGIATSAAGAVIKAHGDGVVTCGLLGLHPWPPGNMCLFTLLH